ncbi:hypothetical protein PR048_026384 [Dryococelus australis]|uniref:MMS22-like C-terminal domain-containing protein n=1 Tax=Dryococelus australis TaxID=614101 RepID=A0ABQ9GL89_9NEOP|nr:hypothetical protein PR048_026384 [Dryococelus australis]
MFNESSACARINQVSPFQPVPQYYNGHVVKPEQPAVNKSCVLMGFGIDISEVAQPFMNEVGLNTGNSMLMKMFIGDLQLILSSQLESWGSCSQSVLFAHSLYYLSPLTELIHLANSLSLSQPTQLRWLAGSIFEWRPARRCITLLGVVVQVIGRAGPEGARLGACVLQFVKRQFTGRGITLPPQVFQLAVELTVLSARHSRLVPDSSAELFRYFGCSLVVDAGASLGYLCLLLQRSCTTQVLASQVPGYTTLIVQSWIRRPVMLGNENCVAAVLREEQETLAVIGCPFHLIDLASEKASATLLFNIHHILIDVFYYLEKSAKRKGKLQEFQNLHSKEARKILKRVCIWWLSVDLSPFILSVKGNESTDAAVDELQKQFTALQIENLPSLVNKDKRIDAKQFGDKNRTKFRSQLSDKCLESMLVVKCNQSSSPQHFCAEALYCSGPHGPLQEHTATNYQKRQSLQPPLASRSLTSPETCPNPLHTSAVDPPSSTAIATCCVCPASTAFGERHRARREEKKEEFFSTKQVCNNQSTLGGDTPWERAQTARHFERQYSSDSTPVYFLSHTWFGINLHPAVRSLVTVCDTSSAPPLPPARPRHEVADSLLVLSMVRGGSGMIAGLCNPENHVLSCLRYKQHSTREADGSRGTKRCGEGIKQTSLVCDVGGRRWIYAHAWVLVLIMTCGGLLLYSVDLSARLRWLSGLLIISGVGNKGWIGHASLLLDNHLQEVEREWKRERNAAATTLWPPAATGTSGDNHLVLVLRVTSFCREAGMGGENSLVSILSLWIFSNAQLRPKCLTACWHSVRCGGGILLVCQSPENLANLTKVVASLPEVRQLCQVAGMRLESTDDAFQVFVEAVGRAYVIASTEQDRTALRERCSSYFGQVEKYVESLLREPPSYQAVKRVYGCALQLIRNCKTLLYHRNSPNNILLSLVAQLFPLQQCERELHRHRLTAVMHHLLPLLKELQSLVSAIDVSVCRTVRQLVVKYLSMFDGHLRLDEHPLVHFFAEGNVGEIGRLILQAICDEILRNQGVLHKDANVVGNSLIKGC